MALRKVTDDQLAEALKTMSVAKVITYHKAYGEVGRLTINSDMLKVGGL